MIWRPVFLLVLSLTLCLGGCLDTDDVEPATEPGTAADELLGSFADAMVTGDVAVRNATLIGNMGNVEGLRHYATAVDSYSDGRWASIHVTVDTGAGAGMTIIDVWDLSQLDLAEAGASTSPGISIIGCAGDEPGMWDFDQSAEEVEVDVIENPANPDEITLDYTATFRDYSSAYYPDGDGYYSNPNPADLPTYVVTGTVTFMRPEIRDDYGYDYGQPLEPVAGTQAP